MRRIAIALTAAMLSVTVLVTTQEALPEALVTMAETEREFARTARLKGIRDAFLDFFADDSIALRPGPMPAKDGLRKQPSRPFSVRELVWEPRFGDVAASGELGWLTGPSTFINHEAADKKPAYGCYLSVWRKQPDGRWRVYIDVGTSAPAPVLFAAGFTRAELRDRYHGAESKETASRSLSEADRALNASIAAHGPGRAYVERLTPASRLHRNDLTPLIGVSPISDWLERNARAMQAQTGAAEASTSGDFGYSYGTYNLAAAKSESGPYVRIWSRDAAGRWHLMADVAHPTPKNRS